MHRRSMRVVVASLAAASLALTACASKSAENPPANTGTNTGPATSAPLTIKPVVQIDRTGKEVPASASSATAADPAGDGKATCSNVNLAMAGALTGDDAALGKNILGGGKLALDKHNKANPNCQVKLLEFDTGGSATNAPGVISKIIQDPTVIGLLGPAFSGETQATGDTLFQANLASLTASATRVSLTTFGWKNFFRGLGNDGLQAPAVAAYMTGTLKYSKICIINDEQAYSTGLADEMRKSLADKENKDCASEVKKGGSDFSSAVSAVKGAAGADAIFYAGYYAEAAKLVKQLRDGGVTIPFVSADGTNDPQFVSQAGSSSKDAILSCPCGPAPDQFATDYKAINGGVAPGVYSVEGYDLTTIMLKGIDSGIKDRNALVEFVRTYKGDGLARNYSWDATGELASALIWIYKVQ
jgi:branched-chain amino acid transport system substrate-binding protein